MRVKAAAALAAFALFLPLAGSEAAVARPVEDIDLPAIEDVAAIYPFYEGGWRQFRSDPELILISSDCLHDRVGPTAPSGGYALYSGPDPDPSPWEEGGPEPQVEVYRFNSNARAHLVLDKIRTTVTRCYGRFAEGERVRVRVRRAVPVPDLGAEAPLAWRTHVKNSPEREATPEYYGIDIWMRRGRFLILADVYQLTPPTKADAVLLARAALASIG
jgi:hypothetical protein